METQKNITEISHVERVFAAQAKRRAWWWEAARIGIIVIFGAVTLLQSAEVGRLRGYVEGLGARPANAAAVGAVAAPAVPGASVGLPSQVGGC